MNKTKLSINTGLKLVVWGIPAGLVLRVLTLNLWFDFDTGFYTGWGPVISKLSLILPVLLAVIGGALFWRNSGAFTQRAPGPARGPGIFAGLSGGVLLVEGAAMLKEYSGYALGGSYEFGTTPRGGFHVTMAVLCLVFGAAQCLSAAAFCMGSGLFKRAPLLYLTGAAWGVMQMCVVYSFYAVSSSRVENLFSVGGSALMVLALFYVCGVLGGWREPGSICRLYISGGLCSVVVIPYDLANIAAAMGGNTYFGELPAVCALGRLLTAMFILSVMLSCYRTAVDKKLDGAPAEARHLEG